MRTIGFNQANNEVTFKINKPWQDKYCQNSTIFGKNVFLPINMKRQLNDNTLVIGTSGTGKTYSFVEPNVLQGNANYIIADSKGDILRDIGCSLQHIGYSIKVINLVDLTHSMTYNPLAYVHNQLDVMQLADEMVSSDVTGSITSKMSNQDPYWDNAASSVLQALILFVKEFLPSKDQTINSVIDLYNIINLPAKRINDVLLQLKKKMPDHEYRLDLGDSKNADGITIGDCLFWWAEQKNPRSQAVRVWGSIAATQGASRTWSSVMGIVGASLTRYEAPDVVNLLSSNQISFCNLLKPKTALFILYDDADPSKNFISNTLYTQLFSFLYRAARRFGNKLPVKVRFFLDDFKNIDIPNFPDYLATARSRNISICMMLQDESQLRAKFGTNASNVIGNCPAYLLTGTTDLTMANIAADRFNISSRAILQKDNNHFLLDVGGYIAHPVRFDFHTHPNYIPQIFNVNKFSTVQSILNKESKGLLDVILNLPNLSRVDENPIRDDLPF